MKVIIVIIFLVLFGLIFKLYKQNSIPQSMGLIEGKLSGCPGKPNCVSTSAAIPNFKIVPLSFNLSYSLEKVLTAVKQAVYSTKNMEIDSIDNGYIKVIAKTKLGFIDDVEIYIDMEDGMIQYRSASRAGHGDFNKNRERYIIFRDNLLLILKKS
ncbi:MAG: DUF1499 domain-containing protein [Francisellaceae bacterium]|nr:DUF1499 domain-containing protein [Francisellaceae bacterium]